MKITRINLRKIIKEAVEELFGKLSPSSAYIIKITQEMRNGKNEQKTIEKLNC